jgi:hypothetical protein
LYGYQTRYGFHHSRSTIEIFKDLVDDINSEFLNNVSKKAQDVRIANDISKETRSMVNTITFAQNCIIITKKNIGDIEFSNRRYRFERNL